MQSSDNMYPVSISVDSVEPPSKMTLDFDAHKPQGLANTVPLGKQSVVLDKEWEPIASWVRGLLP